MNPDFFARNIPLANHLIKSEPGKEDKRKDKNRLPALLQQSKINEEDLTPEERERRERERRLNSNQLRFTFSRKTLRSVQKRLSKCLNYDFIYDFYEWGRKWPMSKW